MDFRNGVLFCFIVKVDGVDLMLFFLGPRLLAPRVQKSAPDFKGVAVANGEFKDIQLSDFKGKYLVLVFYPLDL